MRLSIEEACSWADRRGLVAFPQRGFYSHFLRVRTKDYRTLATIDIIRRSVSRRSLMRAFEQGDAQ